MDRSRYILIGLMLVAAALRFWDIGGQDLLGDEANYAFRSAGYLDYLGTDSQTQPVEWYADAELPWWTSLSFHDHPPLVFLAHFVFLRVFGDTNVVAHLPSVLSGMFSVLFAYAIARRLYAGAYAETFALFAAAMMTVANPAVGVSRAVLMEGLQVFVLLAAVYAFFRYIDDARWWWVWGATVGAAMLTKYTSGAFVLAMLAYCFMYRREMFRNARFYCAGIIALILFSPVIIYNVMLYNTRGHFDLQFAYMLGQPTPEWTGLIGKVEAPFRVIIQTLPEFYGPIFLTFFVAGLAAALWLALRKKASGAALLIYSVASVTAALVFIGAAPRFLALYLPVAAILAAIPLAFLWESPRYRAALRVLVIGALLIDLGRTINVGIAHTENFGVAALDRYLEAELRGKRSAAVPESTNRHLNEVIQVSAARAPKNLPPEKALIVYNDNVALGTLEWIFYRRFFYHAIPTLYVENFLKALQVHGGDYFDGFTVYFVQSTPATELNPFKEGKVAANIFEEDLVRNGVPVAASVKTRAGAEAFRIYKFEG